MSIVERIEQLGIRVTADAGHVVLEGNTGALSDEQIAWIKAHKPAILQELRERVVSKLGALAREHRLPLDDLLDWYGQDIEDMTRMDDHAIAWLVEDYARLRSTLYRVATTQTAHPPTPQQAAAVAVKG